MKACCRPEHIAGSLPVGLIYRFAPYDFPHPHSLMSVGALRYFLYRFDPLTATPENAYESVWLAYWLILFAQNRQVFDRAAGHPPCHRHPAVENMLTALEAIPALKRETS
jgi:hypothetical protein